MALRPNLLRSLSWPLLFGALITLSSAMVVNFRDCGFLALSSWCGAYFGGYPASFLRVSQDFPYQFSIQSVSPVRLLISLTAWTVLIWFLQSLIRRVLKMLGDKKLPALILLVLAAIAVALFNLISFTGLTDALLGYSPGTYGVPMARAFGRFVGLIIVLAAWQSAAAIPYPSRIACFVAGPGVAVVPLYLVPALLVRHIGTNAKDAPFVVEGMKWVEVEPDANGRWGREALETNIRFTKLPKAETVYIAHYAVYPSADINGSVPAGSGDVQAE